MNLRELLRNRFGVDLPIGETGTGTKANPIRILRQTPNDYTSVEYAVVRYIALGRGVTWKTKRQAIVHHDGRTLDELKIETVETTSTQIITQVENYYFDITDCVGF